MRPLRAAVGLSPAEIAEVLLHSAVYAGVPAANVAFAVARRVLAEEDTGQGPAEGAGPPNREPV